MDDGFELTSNPNGSDDQEGHMLCRTEFKAKKSEIEMKFTYRMTDGQGLCAYLLDPSVDGWDTEFNGIGPLGFRGKTGAILGVAFDHLGNVSGGNPSHCTIFKPDGEVIKSVEVEGGFLVDTPRSVMIRFDIDEGNCDVKFDGEKILDDVEFGFEIPKTLAIVVCAAAD